MEDKLGVFICTGYGIAEALDIEALKKVATDEFKIEFCRTIDSCETVDLEFVRQYIKSEGLTKVLIAGVSARRYSEDMFPEGVIVEKFALREHVVWCQPPNEEDTQMAAEDYLRMYITRIQKVEPIEPFQLEETIDKSLMVVGGGITGLTAALEAAHTGYEVRLVEKADKLGGWLAKQYRSVPTKPPFRDLEDTGVDQLIAEVNSADRIRVYTSAIIRGISGAPGLFDVTLAASGNGSGESEELDQFRVGAIIQATGWRPAEPRDSLPYGQLDDVIRNIELEQMVKEHGRITRPSDGKEVKSIAFIQCGGSRHKEHLSYCSSICCLTSLKQAMYLRESDENAKAYIFYEFIRTPGHYEDFYRRVQDDPGVFLTKGEVADVTRDADGQLVVTARNTMPGAEIEVKVDLVVLAAGMIPNAADGEAIRALEDAKKKAVEGESDIQRQAGAEQVEELKAHEGTEILNLDYRQGPDLPALQYGYPDSHFICFPYESRRTGIYVAGCVRQPMDGRGSREDAAGAALKAIQCVEMTSRGEAVHQRSGDNSYPDFFLQGICLGACPERIISFKDYSVAMVAAMIKAVEVPDEDEEKPRILAFLCENDAFPALDLVGQHRMQINPYVRVIPVRCLGSINSVWVTEAISAGYDGVILIGCKYGDDYQCHFIKGSELADYRGENIREKLEQMAMENERVELHQLQISEYYRLPEIFAAFQENVIDKFGMNPFKGM